MACPLANEDKRISRNSPLPLLLKSFTLHFCHKSRNVQNVMISLKSLPEWAFPHQCQAYILSLICFLCWSEHEQEWEKYLFVGIFLIRIDRSSSFYCVLVVVAVSLFWSIDRCWSAMEEEKNVNDLLIALNRSRRQRESFPFSLEALMLFRPLQSNGTMSIAGTRSFLLNRLRNSLHVFSSPNFVRARN